MFNFNNIITYLDYITIIFAFCAMFASGYNLFSRRKDMEEIEIFIINKDKKIKLPIRILRKNITRAEIKGIVSDFEKDHNFTISYLKSPEFLNDIFLIQKGKKDVLVIEIKEYDKFDFNENDMLIKDLNESNHDFRDAIDK
ncbi:hypothetical protein F1B92_06820 [Campylobacter sp. FMV-PI01]|uniref:Uncharacterized protein n=1 Tax=Campylobacter portucalensis TaxID=2608384 RepID=A0A6L5WKU5_9BACT|nr:hypothetical protein [Campylobacter portucalensis]MSN96877.1 hypothetical protein [Campylobacter portucalensis]